MAFTVRQMTDEPITNNPLSARNITMKTNLRLTLNSDGSFLLRRGFPLRMFSVLILSSSCFFSISWLTKKLYFFFERSLAQAKFT